MKKISLLFAFVALFATASFAGTKEVKNLQVSKIEFKGDVKEIKQPLKKATCKVTVTYGSTTLTMTATCDCTTQQACDIAYAALSIVIP